MNKRARIFFEKFIFTDALDLQSRVFNLFLVLAGGAEVVALAGRIIAGTSFIAALAVALMIPLTIALFWLCGRLNLYKTGIRWIAFFIFNALFPLIFFVNGGANSGMTGYFVLSLVLIFFLFKGKECIIMAIVHALVIAGCYLTDKFLPQTVIPISSKSSVYIDIIQAIVVSSVLIGLLIKFQIRIYEIEKEKAVAASKAKADFLAGVSHEIRTPLNAIIGLGEIELNKNPAEETRKNLEKIYDSGMILLNIINDLLDITKIESRRFELASVEYQTASFINNTATLNMVRIGSKPINFVLEVDENLPAKLIGDELRIKQILNNLLSNAIHYTNKGFVKLSIKAETPSKQDALPAPDSTIIMVCAVEDTGIGIKPENLEKIFGFYEQIDMKRRRNIEGTGLGLSICKNLIKLMGGTITAQSEYGKGSVFTARIPQQIADKTPLGRPLADNLEKFHFSEEKRERRKNIRNPMPYGKVLIVDDVDINLEVARGIMEPYGMIIDCVQSGAEAARLIREQKTLYDAVFMDHMMPEMDGIEAVKLIRSEPSDYARNVPVIALTANAIIGNEKMFLENGFQDYLSKPIDTAKLDVILNKWVRNLEKENSSEWKAEIERLQTPPPDSA